MELYYLRVKRLVSMIIGIGLDLIELHRIEKLIERQNRFPNRILTKRELVKYEQMANKRKVEFLAGRFAVKEAYAKAIGTGIGKHLSFHDIEIEVDENGKPFIHSKDMRCHVSITHTNEYAAAQVIIEKI